MAGDGTNSHASRGAHDVHAKNFHRSKQREGSPQKKTAAAPADMAGRSAVEMTNGQWPPAGVAGVVVVVVVVVVLVFIA
jgi:hypothetical protein